MARRMTRHADVPLAAMVLLAGIALGRVIEAVAVAAVLMVAWGALARLLTAPAEPMPDHTGDPRS
jgi:hypothetical protein